MNKLVKTIVDNFVNGGSTLVLMGAQWLYLWVFPWRESYLTDPKWGHNYVMALAFLAVGLAYFSRRLLSDILAVLAALLIIPASFALFPHSTTSFISAALVVFILIDMTLERRGYGFFEQSKSSIIAWSKKYLMGIAYILLATITPCFFLFALAAGTCDADIDAILFDIALLPFITLLLLERVPTIKNKALIQRLGFFWGMMTMVIILAIMTDEPETLPNLIFSVLVTLIGAIALFVKKAKLGDR